MRVFVDGTEPEMKTLAGGDVMPGHEIGLNPVNRVDNVCPALVHADVRVVFFHLAG